MVACNDKSRLEKELQGLNAELETKRLQTRTLSNQEAASREELDRLLGGGYEPEVAKKLEDKIKETEAAIEKAGGEENAARNKADASKKRLDAYNAALHHP